MQGIFPSLSALETLFGIALPVWLMSARLGAVLLLTPLLHAFPIPTVVRVLVVIGLSAALAWSSPVPVLPLRGLDDVGGLLLATLAEVTLGATLALGIHIAFAAVSMAGRLLDVQIGFGMAQVMDPVTQRQTSVITAAFNQVAVLVFFLVDGHHALLRGLAYSLEKFPLGRAWAIEAAAPVVLKQATGLFTLAIALAAPVIFCMLMVDLALGVLARNLPQMNVFVVGLPLKIVAGVAALSVWFVSTGDVFNRVYGSIYRAWDELFAAAPWTAPQSRPQELGGR